MKNETKFITYNSNKRRLSWIMLTRPKPASRFTYHLSEQCYVAYLVFLCKSLMLKAYCDLFT